MLDVSLPSVCACVRVSVCVQFHLLRLLPRFAPTIAKGGANGTLVTKSSSQGPFSPPQIDVRIDLRRERSCVHTSQGSVRADDVLRLRRWNEGNKECNLICVLR